MELTRWACASGQIAEPRDPAQIVTAVRVNAPGVVRRAPGEVVIVEKSLRSSA